MTKLAEFLSLQWADVTERFVDLRGNGRIFHEIYSRSSLISRSEIKYLSKVE